MKTMSTKNLKNILCETIEEKISSKPIPESYDAHLTYMLENYYFHGDKYMRTLHDSLYLTGWHTRSDCIQEVFHAYCSDSSFHAWKTPFADGMYGVCHAHTHMEVIYAYEGTCRLLLDGKTIILAPGKILLIQAGIPHAEILCSEESTVFSLGVDENFLSEFEETEGMGVNNAFPKKIQQENVWSYLLFSPESYSVDISYFFRLILLELSERLPGGKQLIYGATQRIFALLSTDFGVKTVHFDTTAASGMLVRNIQAYIREHYAETSAADVSTFFHYHPDYLNRIFRETAFVSLAAFIQNVRLEEAYRLIQTTNLTIEQIIHAVGYRNQGFFYQKFRQKYGILPKTLRENSRTFHLPLRPISD